jgi:hypothetical protein
MILFSFKFLSSDIRQMMDLKYYAFDLEEGQLSIKLRALTFLVFALPLAWLGADGVRGEGSSTKPEVVPAERKSTSSCLEAELAKQGMFIINNPSKEREEREKHTVQMMLDWTVPSDATCN